MIRCLYYHVSLMVVLPFVFSYLVGCSQIPSAQFRQDTIRQYRALAAPQILILRPQLSVRSPELLIGASDQGPGLSKLAGIGNPLQIVAEQFIVAAGLSETTSIIEVRPDTLNELRRSDPSEPVIFFFSGGWYLDYQRFPPKLRDYQLSFSIIGKLLPRGLVTGGEGTLSLPRASWVAQCYYVGNQFPLQSWQSDHGQILLQEMHSGLDRCRNELAFDFKHAMSSSAP